MTDCESHQFKPHSMGILLKSRLDWKTEWKMEWKMEKLYQTHINLMILLFFS